MNSARVTCRAFTSAEAVDAAAVNVLLKDAVARLLFLFNAATPANELLFVMTLPTAILSPMSPRELDGSITAAGGEEDAPSSLLRSKLGVRQQNHLCADVESP